MKVVARTREHEAGILILMIVAKPMQLKITCTVVSGRKLGGKSGK